MSGFVGRLQRYIAEIVPEFLQGPNAGAFLEALGLTLDDGLQTLVTGLRQGHPFKAFVENLPTIGNDRGIRRYAGETEQSFRLRLAQWRQILRSIASPKGVLLNLQPYFLPGAVPKIHVVYQCGDGLSATWHTLDEDHVYTVFRKVPSNWSWDSFPLAWSRFWVIIHVDAVGPDGAVYGDGTTYGDGSTVYGGHLNAQNIADIVGLINEAKAPYSTLAGLILATDPASFDPASAPVINIDGTSTLPAGNWDNIIDPITGLPTRLVTALFPYDTGVL